MIWIKNSDVQIFQIYGHTTQIPDFRVNGPSENRLKSDMSDSPNFYISEIRGDRFTDFCVHTARLSGNRLQKVGQLEKKSGSGTTALTLSEMYSRFFVYGLCRGPTARFFRVGRLFGADFPKIGQCEHKNR